MSLRDITTCDSNSKLCISRFLLGVIPREFSTSLKKSRKFMEYVTYSIKCHVLVLEKNLLVSDLKSFFFACPDYFYRFLVQVCHDGCLYSFTGLSSHNMGTGILSIRKTLVHPLSPVCNLPTMVAYIPRILYPSLPDQKHSCAQGAQPLSHEGTLLGTGLLTSTHSPEMMALWRVSRIPSG